MFVPNVCLKALSIGPQVARLVFRLLNPRPKPRSRFGISDAGLTKGTIISNADVFSGRGASSGPVKPLQTSCL